MSVWEVVNSEQYERDLKRMLKKYPRETKQMLLNLSAYKIQLEQHDNPLLMVEYPFVHREAAGCHALTQQPLSSSAQTRLYLYCYVQGHELHLICIGDKTTQPKDNKFCTQYVNNLK